MVGLFVLLGMFMVGRMGFEKSEISPYSVWVLAVESVAVKYFFCNGAQAAACREVNACVSLPRRAWLPR
jgi:hypothetical protein